MGDLAQLHSEARRVILRLNQSLEKCEINEGARGASQLGKLETEFSQLQKLSLQMESIWRMHVIKENSAKRDIWKRKVEQVSEDVEALGKSIGILKRRSYRFQQESRERDELFSRRQDGASIAAEMDEESQLATSVERSKTALEEAFETGTNILETMTGNKEIFKKTQKQVLDVLNTVGLSESLLKLIDRRQRGNHTESGKVLYCERMFGKYLLRHFNGLLVVLEGWCVETVEPIPSNAVICEYLGEILDNNEADNRLLAYDRQNIGHALLIVREVLPSGACLRTNIDATKNGNISRFLNHSCDGGNLRVEIERDSEILIPLIRFYAKKDIPSGTELTFAYGHQNVAKDQLLATKFEECYCGTRQCQGLLPNQLKNNNNNNKM